MAISAALITGMLDKRQLGGPERTGTELWRVVSHTEPPGTNPDSVSLSNTPKRSYSGTGKLGLINPNNQMVNLCFEKNSNNDIRKGTTCNPMQVVQGQQHQLFFT